MVTFAVDEVKPVLDRLPAQPLGSRTSDALVFGRDPTVPVVDHGPTHALLGAVHLAFAQHRPLVLSPDVIWLTIAQGIAQHVRLHAEELRPRLVRHIGTKQLQVAVSEIPDDAAGWLAVIPQFRALLAEQIGDGRARLFECAFSTTTDVERMAGHVVLMDAYSPYFDYWMMCVCGIPAITLTGTVDDWKEIRKRVDVVAELDLEKWAKSLRPILDQFVLAAAGKPDRAFWQRIIKPADAYGGEVITGWIARLYPWLVSSGSADYQNPLLDLPIDEPKDTGDWPAGVSSDKVLAGPSSVKINIAGLTATRAVNLEAGIVVVQDAEGRLVPIADWHLVPSRSQIQDVVERIREGHTYGAATVNRMEEGPGEVVGFYNLVDHATIGEWSIRTTDAHATDMLDTDRYIAITRMIDDSAGRSIGFVQHRGQVFWVVSDRNDQPLAELRVVGTRLGDVLTALLDTGEPPAAIGMLAELVRR